VGLYQPQPAHSGRDVVRPRHHAHRREARAQRRGTRGGWPCLPSGYATPTGSITPRSSRSSGRPST